MSPLENAKYSHDFQKFVLQDPNVRVVHVDRPVKPFKLEGPKKSNKGEKNDKKKKQQEKQQEG